MEISEKTKGILVGVGLGLILGFQASGAFPGITDQGVPEDGALKILGVGAAIGFFLGLSILSKANPNPPKISGFVACLVTGLFALVVNLHRGYIAAEFGLNMIALVVSAFLPMLILGGAASRLFSKGG